MHDDFLNDCANIFLILDLTSIHMEESTRAGNILPNPATLVACRDPNILICRNFTHPLFHLGLNNPF